MGSVLSSDSGKSAPASATRRGLERRGSPALPVTSFDCSVCLEVLHQPVRTRCGHVFCRSCIATSLKNNKWTCPYCRAYLPSEGVPATDVAKRMKSEYRNCTECDTLVCDSVYAQDFMFEDFNIIEEALIRRVLDQSLLEYVNHSNTT
ncbi:E3 ubiquitin-protein ligase RNF125 [Trichechus manatus latirostris]|uniref:E3 ubiquitin-protein ligase RNF125 n=1 Tax=Trichechus manatus latirostris TaxID=127582 RepID=A0A2Y9RTL9_TRIMA|nr:E3 ubiquitin-protein ligase RNF125 [Trichechus manatus latirostris]